MLKRLFSKAEYFLTYTAFFGPFSLGKGKVIMSTYPMNQKVQVNPRLLFYSEFASWLVNNAEVTTDFASNKCRNIFHRIRNQVTARYSYIDVLDQRSRISDFDFTPWHLFASLLLPLNNIRYFTNKQANIGCFFFFFFFFFFLSFFSPQFLGPCLHVGLTLSHDAPQSLWDAWYTVKD